MRLNQTYSFKDFKLIEKFHQVVPAGKRSDVVEQLISEYLNKKGGGKI